MNTVVNKLLDVDRDARRIVDEAQQYYDNTMEEIETEKKKMLAVFKDREKRRVEELERLEDEKVLKDTGKIKQRYAALTEELLRAFEDSHAKWEYELYEKCIRR
ncbi:MAG: hypothetical protein FWG94_12775 [Oscillospiraceae bacterium]|nr:hypothetical protein [Oscillospiraceae bacterium]